MLECVINISEGVDGTVVAAIASAAGSALLDVHTDTHHNRSVLTLAGDAVEEASAAVTADALGRLDIATHRGVHPRIGVVDVVPFVPLGDTPFADAIAGRDRFAAWAGRELALPCFLYGLERSLPDIRRHAFDSLDPDTGPRRPHPTAGGCAVGARPMLVAYNLWLASTDVTTARAIARDIRGPHVRALGLDVGGVAQVSMNLINPDVVGPADIYDAVASRAAIERAELVGLVPSSVLAAVPSERWSSLDLDQSRTIEARLEKAGLV